MLKRALALALAVVVCLGVGLSRAGLAQGNLVVATGRGGAVATVDGDASRIGLEVLRRGGNAIDAAIATAAALGVTEPFSTGIGGGGFMVIYFKEQDRVITLDGREQAPAATTVDLFQDPSKPGRLLPFSPNRISSGAAVGVPGAPLEWAEALNRYGTLSLAAALEPAIALAQRGFVVDRTFVQQIEQNQARLGAFSSTRALYLPKGQPPVIGSRFKNPDLAKTYGLLAEQGVNAFYRGDIAAAVVHTVQRPPVAATAPFPVIPGAMTLSDLDRYGVRVRPPTVTQYRGHTLYSMGLPSSGGITTGSILRLLEGFDLSRGDRAQAWHTVIEAERLAFADRNAYLGDPEFVDVPLTGLQSQGFTQTRRTQMGDRAPQEPDFRATAGDPLPFQQDPSPSLTSLPSVAQGPQQSGLSTTHLVTSDRWGNLVSYTCTLESTGGSAMVVPGYGFILNNQLTDFDPISPHPNAPEPYKRPRSSMAPTIMRSPNGTLVAFGSPGGSTIITTVVGIAINLIDFGLSLPEAISAPRISQRNTGSTQVDSQLEQTPLGQGLIGLGHRLTPVAEIGAAVGLAMTPDGALLAAAEPSRRGGGAALVLARSGWLSPLPWPGGLGRGHDSLPGER